MEDLKAFCTYLWTSKLAKRIYYFTLDFFLFMLSLSPPLSLIPSSILVQNLTFKPDPDNIITKSLEIITSGGIMNELLSFGKQRRI